MTGKIRSLNQYIKIFRASKLSRVFLWDVLSKGADFALLPVYLTLLTREEYGFYTFSLYIITTASGIIKLGMDTSVSKMFYETGKYERSKMLFSLNSVWVIFFSFIVLLSFITGWDITFLTKVMNIAENDYHRIRIFLFVYTLFNLVQYTLNVFFVIDDKVIIYQKYNFIRTIISHLIVILILVFVAKGNKAYVRLYVEPGLFIISFIPLIYILIKRMKFVIDRKAIRDGLKIGLPMMGTVIVAIFYNLSDKYYLQKSGGYDTLAVYNLAIYLTLPVSLIFGSFQTVWFPEFLQIKSGKEKFMLSLRHSRRLFMFYIGLLAFMCCGIFLVIYIGIIPKNYMPVLAIFPFIFLSRVIESLIQLFDNFVVVWGKTLFNLATAIVFGLLTLFFNYLFIPRYGVYAAITILLSLAIGRFAIYYFFVKYNTKNVNSAIV